MKCLLALAFAAGATLLPACDDDERRRPWDTTLDDDSVIGSVGDDDRRGVCRSLEANLTARLDFSQLTRLVCLPGGLLRGNGSPAMCEQLVDECVRNNTPPPLLVGARIDQQRCVSSLSRCNARVGALEGCVNLNVGSLLDLLESLTCARIGDGATIDRARRALDTRSTLTSCTDLSSSCQDFVDEVVVE